MNLPKLDLPLKGTVYTFPDYQDGNVPKGGFADTFFRAFEEAHDRIYQEATSGWHSEIREGMDKYTWCHITNEYNERMRREIDRELQSYMMKHDGVIDAYPYPVIAFDITVTTTEKTYNRIDEDYDEETYESSRNTIIYDHFGTPWSYRDSKLTGGEREFRYVRHFCSSEYDDILTHKKVLESRISEAKAMPVEKFKSFLCSIPAIIGVVLPLLLFISYCCGWDHVTQAVGKWIPFYLKFSQFEGYSFVHFVALLVLGFFLSSLLRAVVEPRVDDRIGSLEEEKKEYDEFVSQYDFVEVEKMAKAYKNEYNRLSEQWHRMWFEYTYTA